MGNKGGTSNLKSVKPRDTIGEDASMPPEKSKAKKRGSSYLDELLAQRAAKKSKKKSKAV
jgi:hypothetical protein